MDKTVNERAKIVQTADGSCTLYLEDMDETYHSRHGALAESLHVYIRNGLDRLSHKKHLNILEVGFGTGLNALLTLDHRVHGQQIRYFTIEPYPLTATMIHAYYGLFEDKPINLASIDSMLAATGQLTQIQDLFRFKLIGQKLEMLNSADIEGHTFDLVYYDAFGPSKQAAMWTEEMLKKVTDLMSPGGLLVTYCAQGQFKRNLKSLGLQLEHPPGPWGKREMTVGIK